MHWWFEAMDLARRQQGVAMDLAGLGPRECPSRVVLALPGLRLRFYGGTRAGAAVLIIPAPIKRHYIWDLLPDCSAVRRLRDAGLCVYLIEWLDPDGETVQAGLEQYGLEWIEHCVEAIRAGEAEKPLFVCSHSLGGILSVIYTALRPEQVSGLVLFETPLHFGDATGSFAPMLALGPPARAITRGDRRVPGSWMSTASSAASPVTFFIERHDDLLNSLGSGNHLMRHLLVERWALDETAMAARLFEDVVDGLYREDRLMRGTLRIAGRRVQPRDVQAPMLAVYDPRSLIVPPAAVTAFLDASSSVDKQAVPLKHDVGVALSHVAALAGPCAHSYLWPRVLDWIRQRADPH